MYGATALSRPVSLRRSRRASSNLPTKVALAVSGDESLVVTPWSLNSFSTAEDGVDTGKHEFQSSARDLANAIREDLLVQSDSKRDICDGILR